MTLLGPLFRYELTRLARRGLQPKLRAGFAGLLLGALLVTYLQAFPGVNPADIIFSLDQSLPIEYGSRFGERFLTAFLVVQLIVVVVATPAVAGGAIAEEKERRSLDFLLSSPLTGREIVFGKLAARLVYVAGVVLTGLPVLALTMFFGGVDGPTLLAGYGITLLTMLSLGAHSIYLAVVHDTLRGVLFRAYGTVLGLTLFGFCCSCFVVPALTSPFSALYALLTGWPVLLGPNLPPVPENTAFWYALAHVPVGALLLWRAVVNLRTPPLGSPDPRPLMPQNTTPRDDLPRMTPVPVPRYQTTDGPFRFRTVYPLTADEDPLEWKERWFGGRIWPVAEDGVTAFLVILAGLGLFLVLLPLTVSSAESGRPLGYLYGPLARVLFLILLPGAVLGIGVMTSGSVARERERQTLESLLSIPVERRAILRAKARAAVREVRPLVWALAVFYALGVVTGGVTLLSLVVAPLLVVGWGGLALAGGMWLSVRCATSARATRYFLLGLLAVFILPPLAGPLIAQSVAAQYPTRTAVEMWLDGFSPAVAAWNAFATDPDVTFAGVTSGLGGATAALLVAVLLWRDAIGRFEIEGK